MIRIVLSNSEIRNILNIEDYEFPKYTTQIINLANQNAQGTRPKVVGQMSELIHEFPGRLFAEWKEWYIKNFPETIDNATRKVADMINNFRIAIDKIDDDLIKQWIIDLVLVKTFTGMKFHDAILKKVADYFDVDFRISSPAEESQGIDGFIDKKPVSIKPETYKSKSALLEKLPERIIFYKKAKNRIIIEFDFHI